ncbi:MAG TPA: ABC transporter ATP-binding protein [Polyangiaceae bacterium]|nr:ABC transporter ATP-binding protein [Polyangiaceae bacterium]HOD23064.1 ABC transporter ATP-binding protein [Polyangiaceae bacterium]HOE48972.1 ABC transporter ATP-binding protein [Polyangiaceae bacterium]HOH01516.1 ABC transporter ATP-binding protein [Polyangiaceae bacterium]HOR36449.1 ABC transporter ATP-binding protein [Polyangiaceae bacterium]
MTVGFQPQGPPVLDSLCFQVGQSERVALVGLNGSGKTTLLMATVGLLEHQGTIRVCGQVVEPKSVESIRARVGFLFNVPEDQLLFPKVVDDTAFALLRRGMSAAQAKEKARDVLERLGIGHLVDHPVHVLSHGQKQRVALAGALVTQPPVLLLDEPSAALDPRAKRNLAQLLRDQQAALLVATHDLSFAEAICTRYVLLEGGHIEYDGAEVSEVRRRL